MTVLVNAAGSELLPQLTGHIRLFPDETTDVLDPVPWRDIYKQRSRATVNNQEIPTTAGIANTRVRTEIQGDKRKKERRGELGELGREETKDRENGERKRGQFQYMSQNDRNGGLEGNSTGYQVQPPVLRQG